MQKGQPLTDQLKTIEWKDLFANRVVHKKVNKAEGSRESERESESVMFTKKWTRPRWVEGERMSGEWKGEVHKKVNKAEGSRESERGVDNE